MKKRRLLVLLIVIVTLSSLSATPDINFTAPTPANDSFQLTNIVPINVSTYDIENHSAFIDWNKTLMGWWSFDFINSTNGTIYDNSSYNRHGVLINHTSNTTISGKRGQALQFDGLNDYINLPKINIYDEFTISAWFRINESRTGNNLHTIIGKWDGTTGTKINYQVDIKLGKLRVAASNSSGLQGSAQVYGNTTIAVGQWYHGAATFKDGILKVYINGSSENQTYTGFSSLYNGTTTPRIGAFPFTWTQYQDEFNGTLDEVMVFSRALTPEEIKSLYEAGTYRLYTNITGMQDGNYTYKAYAIDELGNVNWTEERTVNINSTNVVNCTNLDLVGKSYVLESDIINNDVTTLACINISKQDIVLDCQGHLISSVQNVTGIFTAMRNTTVQNCNLDIGGGNKTNISAKGIYFNYTGQYGKILNNIINATYGIYLDYYSQRNIIANNTAYGGTSAAGKAIYLNIASNNNLTSNIGTTIQGYTIMIEQSSNNNILRDNIGVSNSLPAIRIGMTYNNILINNTGISNISVGLLLFNTRNATLINNMGISNTSYGIDLDSALNNTFINNTGITVSGTYSVGLLIRSVGAGYSMARNNTFINNTAITNSTYAILLQNTTDNHFYNQIAIGYSSGSQGIFTSVYANNNTFQDCVNVSGASFDVNITANSTGNVFINCSYNSSKEYVDSSSQLIREWYYSAYVNDTIGNNVPNANITAYNSTNDYQFNLTTLDTGDTPITQIVDYFNNNGTRIYYSNYTIYAINPSYEIPSSHSWNVTLQQNIIDTFTLADITAPSISFISPTPANNMIQYNKDVYVNISNYDANDYSAWIDWNRSLVGWWNFEWINSTNGTIYDNSSYNRHARLINATVNTTVPGKRGYGLEFNGLTYYANLGSPLSNQSEWTYSVWFYPKSNGTSVSALIGQTNAPAVRWGGAYNRIYLFLACLNCSGTSYKQLSSSDLTLNQWHHVVGVFNFSDLLNQSQTLYIDGVRAGSQSWSNNSISNATTNGTIYRPGTIHYLNIRDAARSFNGTLDEVMVFSRALNSEEINASYNAGSYRLYNNFTNLTDSIYIYKAYAIDAAGNTNKTEERTVTVSTVPAENVTPITPGGGGGCTYDWVCSEWYPSPCPSEGIQKRVCVNRGTCAGTYGIPVLNRTCTPGIIEPAEPLFDIFLNIPTESKWILKGDNVSFNVRLINVGNKTTIDVSFQYLVVDENNRLLAEKKETRAVGEKDEFRIEIPLPESLEEGVYKVYVQISYDDGKVATAGDSFEIVKDNYTIFLRRAISLLPTLLIPLLLVLVLILFLIIIKRNRQFRRIREKKKKEHKRKKEEKRERLIKKRKRRKYAKKYKREKRKAEREIRKGKRKAKGLRLLKIKHKEKRKIKPKARKKKARNVEILKPSLSAEFIEKRKILERRHRQKRIKELKREIKNK